MLRVPNFSEIEDQPKLYLEPFELAGQSWDIECWPRGGQWFNQHTGANSLDSKIRIFLRPKTPLKFPFEYHLSVEVKNGRESKSVGHGSKFPVNSVIAL